MYNHVPLLEIEQHLGLIATSEVYDYFHELDLRFVQLTDAQEAAVIMQCFNVLINEELNVAGEHRKADWESGWGENLSEFKKSHSFASLTPRYFGKNQISRLNQRFIRPLSGHYEAQMLSLLIRLVASEFLSDKAHIAEFGCGSGVNLLDIRAVNSNAVLTGLDWSTRSQSIVAAIAEKLGDSRLLGRNFDFFLPDDGFHLGKKSAVMTVAALEQVGTNFEKFLDYILKAKPEICIHLEPVGELLDRQNTLDFLSLQYFKKRSYLTGFLSKLKSLEACGRAKIHVARRTFTGSQFIEGHSLIVWSPCA